MPITRVHCSYHKCLTTYFGEVLRAVGRRGPNRLEFRHFNSDLESFRAELSNTDLASLNNHALDLTAFGDYRISRFVRDPRDLVVSGYFFHLRGAEPWTTTPPVSHKDWMIVNGTIPEGLNPGESFAAHLRRLSTEDGLLAELEFRTRHFESMREWPEHDPAILTLRYEDIIGHERAALGRILRHLQVPIIDRWVGQFFAGRYAVHSRRGSSAHVRDPTAGQWRQHFTPRVEEAFMAQYEDLLGRYRYS